ncbi:hypothetical protein P154DRAFT_576661 [Amniculicola lignicola CBS 123094]|uniref:Uncharacterized protein n=1 Tax=Amniculicola lignicola CBS 123094 TaxID=1392246 RepID=A0A6A5WFP0_9PLEO|nr:hypothetical protein P154DRAFT_576661 [Amniculicola lignicola CBS 123094]
MSSPHGIAGIALGHDITTVPRQTTSAPASGQTITAPTPEQATVPNRAVDALGIAVTAPSVVVDTPRRGRLVLRTAVSI